VSSPEEAIKRVVEAFERSDWSEIDVRWGDVRVHLSTSPLGGEAAAESSAGAATDAAPSIDVETAASAKTESPSADAPFAGEPPAGAHVVVSPSPGIFWRSPEPGLPPFADVGDAVEPSATVCIVEVMKLMNHVKAGAAGTVVAVYGENGVAVRKGQLLFAIVPSEAPS
jgi:acetyl-CoA carboxylase biotin carboxyl carrier protein